MIIDTCPWCCGPTTETRFRCDNTISRLRNILIQMFLSVRNMSDSNKKNFKHDIRCECVQCKSQNGYLPLLVQGIEQKSSGTSGPTTSRTYEPSASTSSARKDLVCEHCKKIFHHRGDMNKHLRIHTGEQPFMCDVCQRKFAHTSNLQRHMRIHTGDKPFKCRICDKSFSRKDKLEAHRSSQTCTYNSNKT